MPLTAAATRAQLADTARNPRRQVKGGQVVTITLNLQNVNFIPENLYDALATLYGAGKVSAKNDTQGQRQYHFDVIA